MPDRSCRAGAGRARRQAEAFGADVAMARAGVGLSLRSTSLRSGVSADTIRRVERGDPSVRFDTLCAIGEAVGLDVVLKGYSSGVPSLRDQGQLKTARLLCGLAHPAWKPRLEAPAGAHGEAVDIGFFGPLEILATEIDRLVLDFQSVHRRNVRKQQFLADGQQRPVRLVMVVQDSPRNRRSV